MENGTQDNQEATRQEITPKPRSKKYRPHITSLPQLTASRILFRKFVRVLLQFLNWLFVNLEIKGLENFPDGPAVAVANHLGDADPIVGWAHVPRIDAETIIKSEIRDIPILGILLDAYGVIWVHRGLPDRQMIRTSLQGLEEGRMIGIAPEGRESLTGSLEEGMNGAAYLALKANVPLVPITITGTENKIVYRNLKKLRRTNVTLTIGRPFTLTHGVDRRKTLAEGTSQIMYTLASQLPPRYQGVYTITKGDQDGSG